MSVLWRLSRNMEGIAEAILTDPLPKWYTIERAVGLLKSSGIIRSSRTLYRWLEEQQEKVFPHAKRMKNGWLLREDDLIAIIQDPSIIDEDEPPEDAAPPPRSRRPGFVRRSP